MKNSISLQMLPQPNDVTCGPTCLHAVYSYYEDDISLNQVIDEVPSLEGGGTLDVLLACHALNRGYKTTICTFNIMVFDPTWFYPQKLSSEELIKKLNDQAAYKQHPKLKIATEAYCEFLQAGGELIFEDLTRELMRRFLRNKIPMLTGLSSTFLYRNKRECQEIGHSDDVRGQPEGHFVILTGYNEQTKGISIADPFKKNPYSPDLNYSIHIDRVMCAVLLGILTYDANFLIVHPKENGKENA